jgi:hypothetical protein
LNSRARKPVEELCSEAAVGREVTALPRRAWAGFIVWLAIGVTLYAL